MMKIFLLEDNPKLREAIEETLSENGYRVDSFEDGQEALEHLDGSHLLYILDIHVPRIDGLELLALIQGRFIKAPVIIISSFVDLDVIRQAYRHGCADFLKKPFFLDELLFKTHRFCGKLHPLVPLGEETFLDLENALILREGQSLLLSPKEKRLLELLVRARGLLVSFEEIEEYVWEEGEVPRENIRSMIRQLRLKIPASSIQTHKGIGYRLIVDLSSAPTAID